jgi:hypothetical protein
MGEKAGALSVSPRPSDFWKAFDHAVALLRAGVGRGLLLTMARGYANRGFTDAADGFTHAALFTFGVEFDDEEQS